MLPVHAGKQFGEVAEWSIALDLKSSEPKGSEGSNPSLSVISFRHYSVVSAIELLCRYSSYL